MASSVTVGKLTCLRKDCETFKFRLYPTNQQRQMIDEILNKHRVLYNQALAYQKACWELDCLSVSYVDHTLGLTQQKKVRTEFFSNLNAKSCQRTLKRLEKAFQSFFRRVKNQEEPGYPRFKGYDRFHSIEFTYGDGVKIRDSGKLYVQHVGEIRVKFYRKFSGIIKTATLTRNNGKYYVCFSVLTSSVPLEKTGAVVGLDLGISHFIATSDGEFFENSKFFRKKEKQIKTLQRKISRRKKGSKRRKKAVQELQKIHEKIQNQRLDVAHKVSRKLVEEYDIICIEDLNTSGMVKNHKLAKSIQDAGWSLFGNILSYKAENAGKKVIKVDPRYTSQLCSSCRCIVKKELSERVHTCTNPSCGLTLDRDVNAAINIRNKGLEQLKAA